MGVENSRTKNQPSEDSLRSSEFVFEHVKMLWDDQVELAETLREKRKVGTSLFAILMGFGIVRVQLYQKPGEALVIIGSQLETLKVLLYLSIAAFMLSAYWLYTDRPFFRRVLEAALNQAKRFGNWFYKKARAANLAEYDGVSLEPMPCTRWPRGRALNSILPDDENLDDWFVQTPDEVTRKRSERLRQAYRELGKQNQRVAIRLRGGMTVLFLGFVLVFASFGLYIWSI